MTVLYRKYRPQKFADLIGQDTIRETLTAQLVSAKISHGYLFAGPRGTGKTSTARILAKALNCEKGGALAEPCDKCTSCLAITTGASLDLIEIDAASNRGIDEIRDLREKIKLAPVGGKFKVYIIDEVHMLTAEAFNALLKTLEEPPKHAIFILCTTDWPKIPQTIVSRLTRFNFARAADAYLTSAILKIAKAEKVEIAKEAVAAIVKSADGSFRDAVSILDQVSSVKKKIVKEDIEKLAISFGDNAIFEFTENLIKRDARALVINIEKMAANGADISSFIRQTILFLEKLLFIKIGAVQKNDDEKKVKELKDQFTISDLTDLMKQLLIAESEIKIYPLPQIPLVLAVCKYCRLEDHEDQEIQEDKTASVSIEHQKKPIQNQDHNQNPKTKIPKTNPKNLAEFEKHWPEFLNKVKAQNAHVVALLRSTKLYDFDGSTLTLEVFYRFHKEKLAEPKITRMLDEILEKTMGLPTKLKFILAQKEAEPPAPVKKSNVVDINEYELEKIAQEIFSE